jgi:hypothetical protein
MLPNDETNTTKQLLISNLDIYGTLYLFHTTLWIIVIECEVVTFFSITLHDQSLGHLGTKGNQSTFFHNESESEKNAKITILLPLLVFH